jgi:RHS repeat-associated protein
VSQWQTWHVTPDCTGVITGCWSPNGYDIPVYHAVSVPIKFSTPTAGSGTIQLTAERLGVTDVGSYNVTVDGTPPEIRLLAPSGDVAVEYPTIQLAWCDNNSLNAGSRWIRLNGVDKTSSFNYVAGGPPDCVVKATSTTSSVAVNLGTSTLSANICDNVSNCTQRSFVLSRVLPRLAVRSELPERQHFAGTAGSQRFFVKNAGTATLSLTLAATCAGTASGCAVAPTSLLDLSAGESRVATVTYTVGSAGAGTAMVTAFDNTVRDSATVAVTAISPPAPVVSVVDVNPGGTVERDGCVTIAAGSDAAFECGDLRIIHPLPVVRTVNRVRAPTLLYNSAHAEPYPIIAASVTLTSGFARPDSVEAVLTIGGLEKARGRWSGQDWDPGATRRIALGFSDLRLNIADTAAVADTTKVFDYTLELATIYPAPTGRQATAVSGKLIVVNRRRSGLGAGWWLAGLERLHGQSDGSKLWVGGDGSARIYTAAGTNVWTAANLDRPDTLRWDSTAARFTRRLPGGIQVKFNAAGQHVATLNRLGHQTDFGYSTGLLSWIALPSQGGGGTYVFQYDTRNPPSTIIMVRDPQSREAKIFINAERVDSIQDPDGQRVRFAYEGSSSRRVAARTDRRQTVTSYSYDAAKKVSRAHVDLQPDSIRLGFRAGDVVGLVTATPKTATDTASAYTSFFGARHFATGSDYVAQESKFWLDARGAPRRIINPLGHETRILREDGQWLAPATEVQAPNQFVTQARYDSRGNIVRSIAVNPFNDGQDAITRYHWNEQWDFADSVVTPEGVVTTMQYDPANGNRLWQQVGTDPARRVTFRYDNSAGLLTSTKLPLTPPDTVVYDSKGNLWATRTPRGFWTWFWKDAFGRDTLIVTPIDSTDKSFGGAADSTLRLRQRTVYTVMDRDTITESIAPNRAQVVRVAKFHDAEGNLTLLARVGIPDPADVRTVITQWRYDRANRRTVEVAVDEQVDSTDYDPAGNAVVAVTRRKHPISGVPLAIKMRYDALNRLIERVTDSVSYPRDSVGIARFMSRTPLNRGYPYYPNNAQNGYTIFGDTVRFGYNQLGKDTLADNHDALVRRSYYRNGMLQTETLKVRTLAELGAGGDFNTHTYVVTYRYDRDGRRKVLKYPVNLAPALRDSARFVYDAATGGLAEVWDPLGNHFVYHYNLRGEMDTLRYASTPGAVFEARTYDDDGALTRHIVSGDRRDATLKYDARQKVLWSANGFGAKDTLTAAYSGLGHLLNSRLRAWDVNLANNQSVNFETIDTLSHDALGNLVNTHYVRGQNQGNGQYTRTNESHRGNIYEPETGRLVAVLDYAKSARDTIRYDSAGSITGTWQVSVGLQTTGMEDRLSYYAADGAVRAADYRRADGTPTGQGPNRFVFEEYRYDAYGRRVWVRARRSCDGVSETGTYQAKRGECRTDLVRRTVWDGFQELVEVQQAGSDSDPIAVFENDTTPVHRGAPDGIDQNPFIGRVLYTYGAVLDQPLSLIRVGYADSLAHWGSARPWFMWQPFSLIPLWNHLGEVDRSLVGTGAPLCQMPNGEQRCVLGAWPFGWNALQQPEFIPYFWHGTVTENKRDKAQTLYRRYRVYDPLTGRFTQEDPIGLAGGLNLYGFANGDPVNFSDPFGLCPPETPWTPECDKPLEDPGLLDPVAWLAGGLAGGLRAFGARLFGRAAVTAAADATVETVANNATRSALNLATKSAARSAVTDLGVTEAQATAANSAIARATTKSTIDLVRQSTGDLIVNITRAGRNGFQVMQSVISPNGAKKVTQYFVDQAGKVFADPKNW